MTSFDPSNWTSTPVSTGRDSSRDAARETLPIVSSNAPASTLEVCTDSTSGSRGKSSDAVGLQPVARRPALDRDRAFVRLRRHDHVSGREQPRDVAEQSPRNDDRAFFRHLRLERGAQRKLHVRGGEVELPALGAQQHSLQHLDGAPGGHRPRDERQLLGELVARTGELESGGHSEIYFNHLLNPLSRSHRSVDDGDDDRISRCRAAIAPWTTSGDNARRFHRTRPHWTCFTRAVNSCTRLYTERSSRILRAILAWRG